MNTVHFITEARFLKVNDEYYPLDNSYSDDLWERYLMYFNEITIIARVLKKNECYFNEKLKIKNKNINFIELPYYIGPLGFINKYFKIKTIIANNICDKNKYICRVPGIIGTIASKELKKRGVSYSVEVVGDPYDVFAPGVIKHPLRVFFRYKVMHDMRIIIQNASAVLYVTKRYLQKRYPANNNSYSTYASDVKLNTESLSKYPKFLIKKKSYNLITIGSLEQMYKSPDIVINALKLLSDKGFDINLTWIGDGHYKKEMINLTNRLNISHKIKFIGKVKFGVEIYKHLDNADIFILISKTEGLPRAMIEAMSRGLPCIGTNVGGIPELIEKEVIIEPNNHIALSEKIMFMINNLDFTNNQANKNLSNSQLYLEENLNLRRLDFFKHI